VTPVSDPGPILRLITGYWGSMALFAANDAGVFTALASGGRSSAEVAAELALPERPLRMLLGAMAGLGLLIVEDGRFSNTPLADTFLVEGRPAFLGPAIQYAADSYPLWGELPRVVRTGAPPAGAESYLGADPERTRRFVWGMHARAVGVAHGVVAAIDLPAGTRLLDLGGGPGTYSLLLARKVPGLSAIVLDLPPIVAIAREIIESSGLGGRIETRAGDYVTDAYPSGMSAALLSGVLHREPEATCRAMLARVAGALEPGGTVIIGDVMLGADHASPPFATLFALHMLVSSERGGAHSKDDQRRWLEDAGFVDVQVRDLPAPAMHTVITARKPG
jgi:3-hydroxy-5-methyl-1-naphthoate 3-O-methyltransferase